MAPLSLKIIQDGGAITRTILFDTTMKVCDAHEIVRERMLLDDQGKDYGLFLTSADDESSGIWLEGHRTLDYYMLRDGDSLQYLSRTRNLRVQLVDGSVKTIQIDESRCVGDLMMSICDRIGITNHEEYGLCFVEKEDKPEEEKPATGTLTLKRKQQTREKDAQLEQLSKKLKTDDNVEWLAKHKTLREIGVDPKETLLMKRRLFYTDRNVDSRDPVQLNLLYVQTRDAILDGRQVVTEEKAIEFAGIQCQVQYGDYNEEKHKPGFIENLSEFLSEQYANSRGVERKVLKEYSRHYGLSPIEAKNLYTKNARELPTYGVTFFLVKEQQKGKKKLVPRLLGINAESILRLDEVTKEILQVWPLTQVRTFRAGRETFTLDFGDYSDKEYTVKTNEAYRIRDILQGYIDIIHKSLAAPFNVIGDEGQAICEDTVESFQGQMIQTIAPMKIVEQSFVGPSKLVPFAESSQAQQGTQIVTVSQIVVTNSRGIQRRGVAGNAGVRGNSTDYLKKLNRVNTNSMETVEFLTDPNSERGEKVSKVTSLATIIEEDMNSIIEGVHQSVKNDNEEVRKKLLSELDELCANFNDLIDTTKQNDFGSPESLTASQEAAEKIVGLCTGMFCSLDPGIKRRSRILKRSHESFIADEKTEATLRRASFIAAASNACKSVNNAKSQLDTTYEGSPPEGYEVMQLESDARKKVGKLNAAIALLMSAQSDPNNLDYTAAITSMTTIDELLPELIQDAKALGSGKDEKSRLALLNKMKALCDAARNICALSGDEDKEQLQDLAYKYAKASDKLLFTFGRGSVADKENEILDLARDIGDKTSMLLMKTHELNSLAQSDPRADEMDKAGTRCGDDSRVLLACAQLTASSIEEPHCQSAMSAAAESLTSSVHHLTTTWKPLVEEPGRRMFEHNLSDHTSDLLKALDKLRDAYADISAEEVFQDDGNNTGARDKRKDRLNFIATLGTVTNKIEDAHNELNKPIYEKIDENRAKKLEHLLSQRLALLNSAIASLICATADRENPDYQTAEQAIATVSEIMPELVRDAKSVSATRDDKAAQALLNDIRALCEATRELCSVHEGGSMQDKNDAASKFANSSSRLCFVFKPKADVLKENMIINLSKDACEKASELLTHVNQLVDEEGGERGTLLDERGASLVDVVQGLLTAAQLMAPSFEDPRSQSTMLGATDDVSASSKALASIWSPLVENLARQNLRLRLNSSSKKLEEALNNLRAACNDFAEDAAKSRNDEKQHERLKFIATVESSGNNIANAQKELDEPMTEKIDERRAKVLQKMLADRLALLNSAIASLIFATADRENPDYKTAEQAITTVSELMPEIVRDAKSLSATKDDKAAQALLNDIRALCEATRELCSGNADGSMQDKNDAASKFANSSSRLCFVFKPKADVSKQNMIIELSKDACEKASALLTHVNELVDEEGGEKGALLDERGASLVDVVQGLLTATQLMAPSLDDPRCHSNLLTAADEVSASSEGLASIWSPMIQNPARQNLRIHLNSSSKKLDEALNNLRAACNDFAEDAAKSKADEKQKERLKFIASVGSSANKIADAQKELNEPMSKRVDKRRAKELQKILADRLALLNSAVASLIFATADRENPDYTTAHQAITTVSDLLPELVRDVKVVSTTKDDKAANALINDIRALCEATRDLCSVDENGTGQDRNDAAAKFAKSSSKLCYVFTPKADPKKGNRIIELSKDACEKASQLLTHVNQLVDEEGGEKGALLDERGVSLVDVVQGLLTAAQLTAPSFSDSRCQSTILATADEVSYISQDLASVWSPLVQNPSRGTLRKELNSSRNDLETALNNLRAACKIPVGDAAASKDGEKQKDQMKFVATVGSTANRIADAEQELDRPTREWIDEQQAKELQKQLADRLAVLNSAIATLMFATADRENPDYKTADQAIATVSELMPELIRDIKTVSATKDSEAANALLNDIRALCNATRDLCSVNENGSIQERNDAAANFAKSSSNLCYVFTPKFDRSKGNMIIELSKDACEKASQLLTHVNQLVNEEGGEKGSLLDDRGASLVDVVQTLLATAQLIAPSFDDPQCRSIMLKTADKVSSSSQELSAIWGPLVKNPSRQNLHQKLNASRSELEDALNNLRATCRDFGIHKVKRETSGSLPMAIAGLDLRRMCELANEIFNNALRMSKVITNLEFGTVFDNERETMDEHAERLVDSTQDLYTTLVEASQLCQPPGISKIVTAANAVSTSNTDLINAIYSIRKDPTHKKAVEEIERERQMLEYKLDNIKDALAEQLNVELSDTDAGDLLYRYDSPTTLSADQLIQINDLSKEVAKIACEICENAKNVTNNLGEKGKHIIDEGHYMIGAAEELRTTVEEVTKHSKDLMHISSAVAKVRVLSTPIVAAIRLIKHDFSNQETVKKIENGHNNLESKLDEIITCLVLKNKYDSNDIKPKIKRDTTSMAQVGLDLQRIGELTKDISVNTSKLSEVASDLAEKLGEDGEEISDCGERLAYTARDLNHVVAEVAQSGEYPSDIPRIMTAANAISSCSAALETAVIPIRKQPAHQKAVDKIKHERQDLESKLDKIKNALAVKIIDPNTEEKKLNFISTLSEAKNNVHEAEKLINEPSPVQSRTKGGDHQRLLAQRLAQLNLAIASLVQSTDKMNPNFDEANTAAQTIAKLLPEIIRDSNAFSNDEASRREMTIRLKDLCDATKELCFEAELGHSKGASDSISKFANASNNLRRVINPRADLKRENMIVELCMKVQDQANALKSPSLVEAAQRLLTTAQFTASSIEDPSCHSKLLSAVDEVLYLAHQQKDSWSTLPQYQKNKLNQEISELTNAAIEIKAICKDATDATLRPVKPPVPRRISSLNSDQGQAVAEKLQFMKSVDDAVKSIEKTKEQIIQNSKEGFEVTSSEATQVASEQLQRKLALASAAASHLVFCNDPKKIHSKVPSKSVKSLSDLFPTIVKDLNKICSPDNPQSKMILDDTLNFCDATKSFCITAKDNNEKLNEMAVDFANKSAKLLYAVDIRADPDQEKEVLGRAKLIGDCASRIATGGVILAQNLGPEDAENLCEAGSRCADAASKLIYVTKLVAPSIQYPQNQNIVLTASDQLLTRVSDFSSTLAPLEIQSEQTTHYKNLETEVQSLEKMLKDIKEDIKDKKLVKRKKVEVLEIEDTPMRQLAMEILDNFKGYVESPVLSMEERSKYAQNADRLSAAIKELDVANALCRKSPQDITTLRRLENATQDLQHALLQSRDEQSNVVDIMDFVKEVITNIESLSETANDITQQHSGVYLQSVKENCNKMAAGAVKLTRPPELGKEATLSDTFLDVEEFAQECQKTLPSVSTEAKSLPDVKSRRQLEFKAQRLTDSVNLLRFAVKSALATFNSAALDETLADLSELENKLGDLLKPIPGMKPIPKSKEDSSALECVWYSAAARLPGTHNLASALTSYVTEQRVRTDLEDPHRKRRLEEHLRRLLLHLKTMVVNTSRCKATWRGDDNNDGVTIGEKIIQELEDCEDSDRKEGAEVNKLINNVDIRRLLFPSSDLPLNEDKKELTKKLHHAKNKLDSMLASITFGIEKPQALSRSLHATAVAAIEYDKIARAIANTEVQSQNQIHVSRIEESAKDMRFATFTLLKESEQLNKEPNSIHRRRKLLDAIRSLNDSIYKLSGVADPDHRENETICGLRLQQNLLQSLRPTCTLGYAGCVEALQSQGEVLSDVEKNLDKNVGMKELSASTSLAADYAMHCAYLISISDQHQETAKCGLVDVIAITKAAESIQDKCVRVICSGNILEAKDAEAELSDNVRRIHEACTESKGKISDLNLEKEMQAPLDDVNNAMAEFKESLHAGNQNSEMIINTSTLRLLDAVAALKVICLRPEVVPTTVSLIPETKTTCDLLLNKAREMLDKTITLLNETNKVGNQVVAQGSLQTLKTGIVQDFDTLVENVIENGRRVGLLESAQMDEEEHEKNKSYIAYQLDLAAKWLKSPTASEDAKSSGVEGVKNVIKIAKETVEDLKDVDNDEMRQVIDEVEKLSDEVLSKYNKEKSRILMQRLKELRKMLDRVVVARVVEEFLEEDPLDDLELTSDDDEAQFAELKQHKVLERSARTVRTARLVATAANAPTASSLNKVSTQVELLAPSLVKAMEARIHSPNHQNIIDDYKALMAQYEQTMSIVRILCDQSVDPVEFVQTAGETMQRMCEESNAHKDPLKSAHTSNVITRLGQRVVEAGLSSRQARSDPELRRALAQAQRRLQDSTSNSLKNDWRQVMAEILQTTNEVESALSGENIFQKKLDPNQPIFAAALDLHAAVREWSAKDNEIVAVAKRMAVLMARLSDFMNHDKKREVLVTSKSIVKASSEVAALAKNLAQECTDLRIRTNLLQLCDRIPTISGQLKMLTTVKGSSLGRQGNQEDKEAMNMLVGNAQNLMQSVQEVVSAAAAASVKIMSQRGTRMRWVRKNYYNY